MTTDNFFGDAPTSLTVEASPSPTSTVFTVSDATDLIEGQYINIEVSSAFERRLITDITGDQVTVSPALSGAPDVPGEVRSTRELIKTSKQNAMGLGFAADVAELKGWDMSYAGTQRIKTIIENNGLWVYDSSSSRTADDITVIQPTTGGGRWLKQLGFGEGAEVTAQTGHGFAVTTAIIYDGADWVLASSTGAPSGCNDCWIVTYVIDANTFIRQKRGKAYIPGHGLKGLSNVIWDTGDVDDIAWQSGTTVRHTWGTNVDLSGVAIGDWVHLKLRPGVTTLGEDYDIQRGYYKITAVSDASNYIEWTNPEVSANTYNISGITDSTSRIIIYGDAGAGDMQYLSETDGELSPFPANGGHIELPLAVVIDEDNIEIIGTCGVPKIANPKTLVQMIQKETPNDADDDFELIGRQRVSFANPQNWHLKFNYWCEDGTSGLSLDIDGATHQGGEDYNWYDDNADQAMDEDASLSSGDTAAVSSPGSLTLNLTGITGINSKKGNAELIYDGQMLFFTANSYGDDGSTYHDTVLIQVDLSAAYLKDVGAQDLTDFDLFVMRV